MNFEKVKDNYGSEMGPKNSLVRSPCMHALDTSEESVLKLKANDWQVAEPGKISQ